MMHTHNESLGSAPFKNLTEDDPPSLMPVHFFPAGFIVWLMLSEHAVLFPGENDPRGAMCVAHITTSCFAG